MEVPMEVPMEKKTCQFKRDVLWKPLFRLFRRFLKKQALTSADYKSIQKHPILSQGKLLAEAMGVPAETAKVKRNQLALLLMVNSHKITLK